MTTKVNIKLTLDIEHNGMEREEVEGAAYWLIQPFIEQFTEDGMAFYKGLKVKSFNIEIEEP